MEELFNGQLSFADIDAEKFLHVRRAHADRRVNAMDRLTDDVINELIQLCLPHYHIKAGETVQQGRPYTRLETMVRVHLLQVSLNLSDPEMESYLASDMVARNFCRVSSTRLFISDSTILRFRHFIEQHGLAQKFLERTVNMAAEAGACSFDMVAADGTFIEAPSSTKNKAHARDPEMASGKKANTWHFGMKEHIAACSESGIIYGTVAAPANEHDITHLGDLLKGLEKKVFLDSGYIGCHKRAEIQAIPFKDVSWYIAARPSAWKKELSISENFGGELGQALVECVNVKRQLEHAKASVRCSIEWCFLWLKRIYGYAKVRYRGLAKKSQSSAHVVCSLQLQPLAQMVRSAKAALLITPKLWCALRLECHGALPTLENDICLFLGKYRVVSALFGKIERLTFTGTFDAFQHLVKSHSFKQICFPHRSEMGVLKSFPRSVRTPSTLIANHLVCWLAAFLV